jgi:hypothetical protein
MTVLGGDETFKIWVTEEEADHWEYSGEGNLGPNTFL